MVKGILLTAVSVLFVSGCGSQNSNTGETESLESQVNDIDSDVLSVTGGLSKVIIDYRDSGRTFDGKGKEFNNGKRTMVVFQSTKKGDQWLYPKDIVFKNWKINGAMRVIGVGPSSDTTLVKESSRKLGHTKRMRNAAPRNIVLQNLLISTDEKIPIVLAPGVHEVTLENSVIQG
ncbi:MAG: hypothetical protein RJB13_2218, partial [Pseudomonadota bacterium]